MPGADRRPQEIVWKTMCICKVHRYEVRFESTWMDVRKVDGAGTVVSYLLGDAIPGEGCENLVVAQVHGNDSSSSIISGSRVALRRDTT